MLWTNEDIHVDIERIYPDEVLWLSCVEKTEVFFKTVIFPELLGKWYSRPSKNPVIILPGPCTSVGVGTLYRQCYRGVLLL